MVLLCHSDFMLFKDLTGLKFGRLRVLSLVNGDRVKGRWLCKCDCGKSKSILGTNLRTGVTKSCGCYQRERILEGSTKHGLCYTPEYAAWSKMRHRCNNPNAQMWKDYGGRGISVCKRWNKFQNFIADMGQRPSPKHSLDRKDNNGNYEPSNCRWATPKEQMNNRRSRRREKTYH